FADARQMFGEYDEWAGGGESELTLVRALQQVFGNGASTIYSVRCASAGVAGASRALLRTTDPVVTLSATTPGSWGGDVTANVKETYTVVDATDIERDVGGGSTLVDVTVQTGQEDNLPDTMADPLPLTGGSNGEDADPSDYASALAILDDEPINVVVLAGQPF